MQKLSSSKTCLFSSSIQIVYLYSNSAQQQNHNKVSLFKSFMDKFSKESWQPAPIFVMCICIYLLIIAFLPSTLRGYWQSVIISWLLLINSANILHLFWGSEGRAISPMNLQQCFHQPFSKHKMISVPLSMSPWCNHHEHENQPTSAKSLQYVQRM